MIQLQNDEQRNKILRLSSNMLIMGGPGSGKTTIALFKAKQTGAANLTATISQTLASGGGYAPFCGFRIL